MDYCLSLVQQNPEYDYVHSISERMFELYSKKNTKATGILTALKHLGIPVEQSYAFGDGKNDIEMLSTVGCGIAMGNASALAKEAAEYVTTHIHEDGVLNALKYYNLIYNKL